MNFCDVTAILIALEAVDMDLRIQRIENAWILTALMLSVAMRVTDSGTAGLMGFAAGVCGVLIVLFPLFLFRALGAGDIKLLCVLAGLWGLSRGLKLVAVSIICGGLLAFGQLCLSGGWKERTQYLWQYICNLTCGGGLRPYLQKGKRPEHVYFSVPILMAVILGAGGCF